MKNFVTYIHINKTHLKFCSAIHINTLSFPSWWKLDTADLNFKILSEDELTCRFLARFTGLVGAIDELMKLLKMRLKLIYKAATDDFIDAMKNSQGGRQSVSQTLFC